jgi:hypothetical protein
VSPFHPSIVRLTYEVPSPGVTAHMRLVLSGSPTARRSVVNPLPAWLPLSLADVVNGLDENHT